MNWLEVRRVPTKTSGSCNFCVSVTPYVWAVKGAGRTMEARFCQQCIDQLTELARATDNKDTPA